MKKHIVFDLDGTLVDSLPGIAEGVRRALGKMRRPLPTAEAVRGMIGLGARHLCARALGYPDVEATPTELLEQVYAHFCREYPHCWQGDGTQPFDGIPRLLRQLSERGAHLAVLSNKPHDVTLPMVREIFGAIPIDPIMGYTGQFPRKPAPDALLHIAQQWGQSPERIVLVGDSLYDALTAQAAGCQPILVTWGYSCETDVRTLGAPVADTVSGLSELLLR